MTDGATAELADQIILAATTFPNRAQEISGTTDEDLRQRDMFATAGRQTKEDRGKPSGMVERSKGNPHLQLGGRGSQEPGACGRDPASQATARRIRRTIQPRMAPPQPVNFEIELAQHPIAKVGGGVPNRFLGLEGCSLAFTPLDFSSWTGIGRLRIELAGPARSALAVSPTPDGSFRVSIMGTGRSNNLLTSNLSGWHGTKNT